VGVELQSWTHDGRPTARVVVDGARLEVSLPPGEASLEDIENVARVLVDELSEARRILTLPRV